VKVRRILFILIAVVLLVGVIGCATPKETAKDPTQETPTQETPTQEAPKKIVDVNIGTGPSGGVYHSIGILFAEVINKELSNFRSHAEPSGAGTDNTKRMTLGEFDIGLSLSANVMWGAKGIGPFQEVQPVSLLATGHTMPWVLLVRADSNINSWADLKGAKIAGPPQQAVSGWELIDTSLEYYNLSKDDLKQIPPTSNLGDAVDLIRAGDLDGTIWPTPARGVAPFIDLAATTELRWLGMEDDLIKHVLEVYPFMQKVTVPAGTNDGQKESFTAVAEIMQVMIHNDIDEETAYTLTKTLCENFNLIENIMYSGREWTLEQAVSSKNWAPYHPGSIKYYQEVGVW